VKVTRIDAHDRLLLFKEQQDYISKGCQDCINNRPDEFTVPFYIFAHQRTIEMDERMSIYNQDLRCSLMNPDCIRKYTTISDVPTNRLIWTPRLTKPAPQSNSMLFKAYPGTDNIKVIWMIPAPEMWDQYTKGNMTESQVVGESIYNFKNNKEKMASPEEDDLSMEDVKRIYSEIAKNPKYGRAKFEMI